MIALDDKKVLVLGSGPSGIAARKFLEQQGAAAIMVSSAVAVEKVDDDADNGPASKRHVTELPKGKFDFAVVSPEITPHDTIMLAAKERGIPLVSELELGYQQSLCLHIAVTGTNGKTTTAQLIELVLSECHRKTAVSDETNTPLTSLVAQTKELDFITSEVSSFQLEHTTFFRPTIAVFLNTAQDHLDRYGSMAEYVRTKARIFKNQQAFDWAIVQSEALAQLRALEVPVPAKVITFSANNRRADIFLDRGLIVSRLEDWSGPLLNLEHCRIRGPHNAESLMAALAVGRVLRLPVEETTEAMKSYELPPHRSELVAEVGGVKFINDSKSTNVGALHRALMAIPEGRAGEANIWLIAGGRDKGFDFHDIGPLLSSRVKGAFLMGEAREKIRAAWSLFTPCTLVETLLEAVAEATKSATAGDIILLSPACSSFDQFRSYQHRGEVYRRAVRQWADTMNGGASGEAHKAPMDRKSEKERTNVSN